MARTTPEARRGRLLLERLVLLAPSLLPRLSRATLVLPRSRARTAVIDYVYRRVYIAYARGDWELNTALMDRDDYVIENKDVVLPDIRPIRHGVEGYLAGVEALNDSFSEIRIVFEGSVQIDRYRVGALTRFVGRGTGSGAPVEHSVLDAHELRDGLVVRQTFWWDREAGLRSLGLDRTTKPQARRGPHPAAVARTTPEARRGRSLLERIGGRFPPLIRFIIRLLFRLPASRLRNRGLRYIYRRAYAAWNRRDWELNTAVLDDRRYELVWKGGLVPGASSSYRGVEGYLEFCGLFIDSFRDQRFDLEEIQEAGRNRLVSLLRQTGSGTASGVAISELMASVDEFDRGLLVRQTIWRGDLDPILRSLGASSNR